MAGHNENKMLKIEGLKFKATQEVFWLGTSRMQVFSYLIWHTIPMTIKIFFLTSNMERCFSNGMLIYVVFHCETCEDQHSFKGRYSGFAAKFI